jgi:nucleolar protein 58
MLVLYETPAGFALFKINDEKKAENVDDVHKAFSSASSAQKFVKLVAFDKFKDTQEAMKATTAIVESKLSKPLKNFLKENIENKKKEQLMVIDKVVGGAIKEKLGIPCIYGDEVREIMRGVRQYLGTLLSSVTSESDLAKMALALSHSLSRYKLKFSPDKIDTMIVQAIALLDDLDKELNIYAMRVKEWYGWHFPELSKVIPDNIVYAKTALLLGDRNNASKVDLSKVLPEEMVNEVKEAALISMGTEINDEDLLHIKQLAREVISISEYRAQLFDYLKNRMSAIAPNLTHLVGELVGARLIAHAGSLMNLAKHPASTVQILGAEKALFRALKAHHNTPKYGLLYHASLIGQAPPKYKGKIARVLAAKCALSSRVDAMGEKESATVGIKSREQVEARLRMLDNASARKFSGQARGQNQKQAGRGQPKVEATKYDESADVTNVEEEKIVEKPKKKEEKAKKRKREELSSESESEEEEKPKKKEKKNKKDKKDKKKKSKKSESDSEEEERPKKKAKKEKKAESESEEEEKPKKKEKKDKKKKKTQDSSDESD